MLSESAVYIDKADEGAYLGFIAEKNLYFIIEASEGLNYEQGTNFLGLIKKNIELADIYNLSSFESYLSNEIRKANLPTSVSISSGILVEGIFYLVTIGKGRIYLKRGNKLAKLIEGNNSASGYVEKNDVFIFTEDKFSITYAKEETLIQVLEKNKISDVVEAIRSRFPYQASQGVVALFAKFGEKIPIHHNIPEASSQLIDPEIKQIEKNPPVKRSVFDNFKNLYSDLKLKTENAGKKKTFTFIVIIIIVATLFWSVVMGRKRKENAEAKNKIETARQLITEKLDQAEDVSFLNLSRSMALVAEARQEVQSLKKELGDKKYQEITELENLVSSRENSVVNKEEKKYEEFFDLALDIKEAKGVKMSLDGDYLVILDNNNSTIYSLSLSNKSLDKDNNSDIKYASVIAAYNGSKYFFVKGKGIYKIGDDDKTKKIVDNDKDWGAIAGMSVYNGNIYLLDKENDEIYKYLVVDEGYSDKKSYFGDGESIDLADATSLAIDSSLYIGFEDNIKKFTAGVRDGFQTSYPEEDVELVKVITSKDVDKVYGWCKNKGNVYILEKNGTYEKQINSGIIKQAQDLVVSGNNIYALVGSKIFKISAE